MSIRLPVVALMLILASRAYAGEWELAVHVGETTPGYEQSFQYDPGPVPPLFPGVTVQQRGVFQLDAAGGIAIGGSAAFFFLPFLGIEGRIDTVDIDVRALSPEFTAVVDLPAPLPDLISEVELQEGTVNLERLFPLSVNLKARTSGRVRAVASGGLSYLPRLAFVARQPVALGVTGFEGLGLTGIVIPIAELRAEAQPEDEDQGRLGFNAGGGVEVGLSERIALSGEFRYFRFQKQTLRWRGTGAAGTILEQMLLQEIEESVPAVAFEPEFYQVRGGIVLRF